MTIRDATDPAAICNAAECLRSGALVALPTETVYGLAANATDPQAVARIYAAKRRPHFNPLIIHVSDLAAAQAIALFSPTALALAAHVWPGPLTLVLPYRAGFAIAELARAGLDTIAVRVPAHPTFQAVLRATGLPLAAPSANRSGHVSATRAEHVAADLGTAVALILDAGASPYGLESTIVDVTGGVPLLLRAGALPRAQIEAVLGVSLMAPEMKADNQPRSPGRLASHYAPRAALRLDATSVQPGEALLAFGPHLPDFSGPMLNLSSAGDLTEAASNLFAALRQLDSSGVTTIAVMPIPAVGLGEAICERLQRAAAPR